MKTATYIGISISEFWELTPYELNIAAESFELRKKHEIEVAKDLATYTAFLTSRWVWEKKIDIDKFMSHGEKKAEMSNEEMLNKVKALNKLFGGEVKIDGTEE